MSKQNVNQSCNACWRLVCRVEKHDRNSKCEYLADENFENLVSSEVLELVIL